MRICSPTRRSMTCVRQSDFPQTVEILYTEILGPPKCFINTSDPPSLPRRVAVPSNTHIFLDGLAATPASNPNLGLWPLSKGAPAPARAKA